VCPHYQLYNAETNFYEFWYMYHDILVHLNGVLYINRFDQSVYLYVHLPIVARQRLGEHIPAAKNMHNNIIIVGRVVFCAICVLSNEIRWVCLYIFLSLLGNGSVNTFPQQTKNCWRRRFICGMCRIKGK
jgi:hypothetical protein